MTKFEQEDPDWGENLEGKVVAVVADIAVSDEVAVELVDRFGKETPIAFIAPAITESRLEHIAGIADDAREEAEERIDESLPRLEEAGYEPDVAAVSDQDPVIAIEDLLRRAGGAIEEVVLVTRFNGDRRWAERDAFDRIRRRVSVPVTALEVDQDGAVKNCERSDPGRDRAPEAQLDTDGNLPRFSLREALAMFVGVVSTIALIILAADCITAEAAEGNARRSTDVECIVAMLLAGGAFLINVPHLIALTLFQSSGYRGMWSTLFARLSLYGTPLAVVVSALLVL